MKEKIAILSIVVNALLAGGKIFVGIFSNSAAILAAGIDSFVDIFSSLISYVSIKMSGKPADKKHPYGHYKFEVLGGVLIMLIILATGIGIVYDAFINFFKPAEIKIGYLAFGVMIVSSVVNEIMARVKTYYGKKENSLSLLSDGVHSKLDVYTSLAILGGLFLTPYWIYADSLLAILMGLYITKEAISIGKESMGSLLDVSAGEEIENKIKSIAKKEKIEVMSIKTQKKGSAVTANLEIKLASNLKIKEATQISDTLREKLIEGIESLQYVVIQIVSHEIESSFYQPAFGKSFSWQGKGPDGKCICPKCGYKIPHQTGIPCMDLKCPKCKVNLERE